MLGYRTVLRLTCFLVRGDIYVNNSYIQVSNTFTIIGLIAESTLKILNNTKSKIFRNLIFEMKVVSYSGLIFKHFMHFTINMNVFNDLFILVLVCKDIEPRFGRTRGFFSTVKIVFNYVYVIHKFPELFVSIIFRVAIFKESFFFEKGNNLVSNLVHLRTFRIINK